MKEWSKLMKIIIKRWFELFQNTDYVFFISGKKTAVFQLNLVWNVFLANISLVLREICCSIVHVYRLTTCGVCVLSQSGNKSSRRVGHHVFCLIRMFDVLVLYWWVLCCGHFTTSNVFVLFVLEIFPLTHADIWPTTTK